MTREQAIIELDFLSRGFHKDFNSARAIRTAIRSLEALDKVINELYEFEEPGNPTLVVTMRIDHLINIINKNLKTVEESIND